MNTQANFTLRGRNPDVLTCIANLSNDEVFTPPEFANRMLDTLADAWAAENGGANIWADKTVKFLDPFTKSGVFLREITSRLTKGLADEIPDLEERVNHILTKQVYGIGITQITSLLARRSVYCSKYANGEHSIAKSFANSSGNIWFERTEHTWANGRCAFCGASQSSLDRGEELETHAYTFIHTDNIKTRLAEIFGGNMQFDVIIGNPPYQLNDGGGTGSSAMPIYHQFVSQAKNLAPRYLSMVIPSRWFTGGRGLDEFRNEMLSDRRIRAIHDYPSASDCFPGIELKGGVCYFLWEKEGKGDCRICTYEGGSIVSESERPLLEEGAETFIRYNEAVSVLHKIRKLNEESFSKLVSANDPFGFDVRVEGGYRRVKPQFTNQPFKNSAAFYYYGWHQKGIGYVDKSVIGRNANWVADYKVYISKAYGAGETFPHQILNKPILGMPNSCCTETYLLIGPFPKKKTAENVISYIETRFFRFLVLLIKNTQNGMQKVYSFVPIQDFDHAWTDEQLYRKYKLTKPEIDFIEKMIRPMAEDESDE
jgi:site-specific DNA-methyltransferase (adenine-specific)